MLFVDGTKGRIAFDPTDAGNSISELEQDIGASLELYMEVLRANGINDPEKLAKCRQEIVKSSIPSCEISMDDALMLAVKERGLSQSNSEDKTVDESTHPAFAYMRSFGDRNFTFDEDVEEDVDDYLEHYDEDSIPSAKELYDYLDSCVWKQDSAKRAAAILAHNVLSGRRQNMMFAGPSGCGKTYIWKKLAEKLNPIYPFLINVVDGSSITTEGFKGNNKWGTLVGKGEYADGRPHIIIIDEADKFIAPKYTNSGENVSISLMSEALKTMEGSLIEIPARNRSIKLDCSKLSFVFCGAFSDKAESIAESESGCKIGFLADENKVEAYDRELTVEDVISFGAMPEFMGRIEKVVNLSPMTEADFYSVLTSDTMGPVKELEDLYDIKIELSKERVSELARAARESKLGMRGIRNLLRGEIDDLLFENEDADVASL